MVLGDEGEEAKDHMGLRAEMRVSSVWIKMKMKSSGSFRKSCTIVVCNV